MGYPKKRILSWDILGYPGISLRRITRYKMGYDGISLHMLAGQPGITWDIPVLLTHECSKSLPNAIIERTIIWILAWKLYFSSAAAAAGDSSRRARLCALARASLGRASLHVRRRRRRGSLLGVSTITPGCCRSLGWFRRRGVSRRRSLGELRSFAGAS